MPPFIAKTAPAPLRRPPADLRHFSKTAHRPEQPRPDLIQYRTRRRSPSDTRPARPARFLRDPDARLADRRPAHLQPVIPAQAGTYAVRTFNPSFRRKPESNLRRIHAAGQTALIRNAAGARSELPRPCCQIIRHSGAGAVIPAPSTRHSGASRNLTYAGHTPPLPQCFQNSPKITEKSASNRANNPLTGRTAAFILTTGSGSNPPSVT